MSSPTKGEKEKSDDDVDVDLYNFDEEDEEAEINRLEEQERQIRKDTERRIEEAINAPDPVVEKKDSGNPLDPTSERFDPMLLLYSEPPEEFFPDMDKVKVYDNVDKFVAVFEGRTKTREKKKEKEDKEKAGPSEPLRRQFLPEQMPIARDSKSQPNLLKWMESLSEKREQSPFKALATARDQRMRVKVFVRGRSSMRGHCTAFLVAFDKHWNMALVDVDETWRRSRCHKGTPGVDELVHRVGGLRLKASEREERMGASTVKVAKATRKTETCQRHVPQMVLRGEHVCSVVILKI